MMRSNALKIGTILLLFSLAAAAFVISEPLSAGGEAVTRARGETLEVENETVTLSQNEEFQSIRIKNNGNLIIRRARITVDSIVCSEDAENTSFKMEDNALLSVFEGKVDINAGEVILTDSTISVIQNRGEAAQSTEDGGHAQLFLVSRKANLVINNTEISVNAQNGGTGTNTIYGGRGGDSNVLVEAYSPHNLIIEDAIIHSFGGRGGDNLAGSGAGAGGSSMLTLRSEEMVFNRCEILSNSGEAGSTIGQAADGGQSEFQIRAEGDILMYKCDIQSIEGLSSEGDLKQKSRLQVKSRSGAFYMDHQKLGDEKIQSLSSLISAITTIDAPDAADLHEVDVGDSPPSQEGNTNIRIFWWAEIKVTDIYNSPLKNAVITYTKGTDPQIYPRDSSTILLTDDKGRIDIEVEARENDNPVTYFFRAAIQGGASASSDQIRFGNENHVTNIRITLMTLRIETVNGEPYVSGMVVGGVASLVGFAIPGNTQNIMEKVSVELDDVLLGEAQDISGEGPPFSEWSYEWDTTVHPNGEVVLNVIGKDTGYEVERGHLFVINQEAINHRPLVHRVRVKDSRDSSKEVVIGQGIDVFVTQYSPVIYINGTVWEPDWRSTYLDLGKKVNEIIIKVYDAGDEIYTKNIFEADDDVMKINESGGYSYSFAVDTGNYKGSNAPYAEGEYTVRLFAYDDSGLSSADIAFFTFDLSYDFYPYIDLYIERWDLPTDQDPDWIQLTFNGATEESHTVKGRFNFTKFSDYDSPLFQDRESYRNLSITVKIIPPSGDNYMFNEEGEFGYDGFEYEFDVESIPADEKGTFTILVTAVDEDGLVTNKEYRARILHDPPPEPFTIVPKEVAIEYGDIIFVFPALLVIVVIVYLALVVFNTVVQRKDQKKKKALLEKMKAEEKKKDTTIEDEIHGGVDSKKYLESTGMAKGSEAFTKELTDASGKPQAGAPPKTETAKPAEQPKPPAAAPPKPGVPAQPQAAPPKPAAPPQAAAAPPKPPAPQIPPQAPPVPAKPPAVPTTTPQAPPAPKQ
ncbi:MAG: hypothetical protein ACMUIG_06465 [Thermoplasmatota archaeon]